MMNNLGETVEDFYSESEMRVEEQDLRLLKALVTDDQAARELSNVYDSSLFMGDAKPFAERAVNYFKIYNQIPTKRVMLDQAQNSGDFFEQISEIWNKLENIDYNSSEYHYDLEKIKGRFTKNQILKLRNTIPDDINADNEQLDQLLKDARANLDYTEKIRKGKEQVYTQKTLREYMPEFRDNFVQKSKDPSLGRGIYTGYSYIDYITNGLSPSDMMIIGGETGAGKSMLLNNMAVQMWMQGNNISMRDNFGKGYDVLYFSLEMPYDQCVRRIMAKMANVSTYALRDCQINDHSQLARLANAANFIDKYPNEFEIVDIPRGVTIDQIEARFLEAVSKGHRPDVVVVDYLGLMDSNDEKSDDWLKLGNIAAHLHEFARLYNITVLTAVQLNRPAKSKDSSDAIGLHRIGRSSQIMHHATIGIQIESRPNEETFSDMKYHIIKNRNGERGYASIDKKFQTASLTDIKYERETDDSIDGFSVANNIDDISNKLAEFGW